MNNNEYKFYQALSRATQDMLLDWTETYLAGIFSEERVIATNDFVYAIGDIPVMLVAHLDTVHRFAPMKMFYDKDKEVIWAPEGLGADDRAGVYAITKVLMDGLRPHILFTTNEEVGGLGAQAASKQLKPEINFVIELDRRGKQDSVYYDLDNSKFEEYINKFGFVTSCGSFSDISYLCPEWKVAGVNLSVGYENEHSRAELLHVDYMYATINKVESILRMVDAENDKFEYVALEGAETYSSFLDNWNKHDFGFDKYGTSGTEYKASDEICFECFGAFPKEMIIDKGVEGKYCGDCYSKLFTTCTKCGKDFQDRSKTHLLCETCRKEA